MTQSGHDKGFWRSLALLAGVFAAFLMALLISTASHSHPAALWQALKSREIQHSIVLSLLTCSLAATLSTAMAVPVGYLLSRREFRGKALLEALFDIPIVLPPMVMGLCLLVFFQTSLGRMIESILPLTYTVAGVVLAQFVIGAAFALRIMKQTFDQLPCRHEEVALTLGCTRHQAFWRIAVPSAHRGIVTAFAVAWARSLGEFGPILVFAGATRLKTEVLPTTVWLELSVGNLEAAIAVSLLLVGMALIVLLILRWFGGDGPQRSN